MFARRPASPVTAFRPAPPQETLDLYLSPRETRIATNGSTIHYYGHDYRLVDANGHVVSLKPRARVLVRTLMDGSLAATYEQQHCSLRVISPAPRAVGEAKIGPPQDSSHRQGCARPRGPRVTDPVDAYFRRRNLYWAKVFTHALNLFPHPVGAILVFNLHYSTTNKAA